MKPNDRQLEILQHALGLDQYGRDVPRRNHFVTGPGGDDYDACLALAGAGLMKNCGSSALTGWDTLFRVTQRGIDAVARHSPAPPMLTRSQQRYRDWLAADSNKTFGDWLRERRHDMPRSAKR